MATCVSASLLHLPVSHNQAINRVALMGSVWAGQPAVEPVSKGREGAAPCDAQDGPQHRTSGSCPLLSWGCWDKCHRLAAPTADLYFLTVLGLEAHEQCVGKFTVSCGLSPCLSFPQSFLSESVLSPPLLRTVLLDSGPHNLTST